MSNDQWVTDLWKLLSHNSKMFFLNFNLNFKTWLKPHYYLIFDVILRHNIRYKNKSAKYWIETTIKLIFQKNKKIFNCSILIRFKI